MSYRRVGGVIITENGHVLGMCHSEVIPNCICASLDSDVYFAVVKDGNKTKILYKEFTNSEFKTIFVRNGYMKITNIFEDNHDNEYIFVFCTKRGVKLIFDADGKRIPRHKINIPRDAIGVCMNDYVRCGNMLNGKHVTTYGRFYYLSSGVLIGNNHTICIWNLDDVYYESEGVEMYRIIYLSHGILRYMLKLEGNRTTGTLEGEWLSVPMWLMYGLYAIDKNKVLRDIRTAFDNACKEYNKKSYIHDGYSCTESLYSDEPSLYEQGIASDRIGELHGMKLSNPVMMKSARKR